MTDEVTEARNSRDDKARIVLPVPPSPSLQAGGSAPIGAASRIAGRGALLRSLRGLLRRVERYGEHKAATADERLWAAQLLDGLEAAFNRGLGAPGAREALLHQDRRRAQTAKGRVRR